MKNCKKQNKKTEIHPEENASKAKKKLKTNDGELLDSKKEQESTIFQDDTGIPFDFDNGLFSKYCSFNRDELSHLFLQNDDDLSVKFPLEE